MISAIPTLTVDGFVTNKHIQMFKLFEYFLASDYSQSNIYYGEIASLKYILATNPIGELQRSIENALSKLYQAYFDKATINTWVEEEGARYHIYIDILAEDNNKTYSLAKEVKASKGNIENYEKLLDELWEEYNKKETYDTDS